MEFTSFRGEGIPLATSDYFELTLAVKPERASTDHGQVRP